MAVRARIATGLGARIHVGICHATTFRKRLGKSPQELGVTTDSPDCPDIWELANGDIAVIGRDLTDVLGHRLPDGVSVGSDERVVVIPRKMMIAAKPDIPSV